MIVSTLHVITTLFCVVTVFVDATSNLDITPIHVTYIKATLFCYHPVNSKHLYNIYTMLVQRQRRWSDVV